MTGQPTLALLIPAYNAEGYLPRLLESAARQTKPFDEIWVYDDCSTDNTAATAERLGARVVRGGFNRGCSHGKNVLALATNAEWVHFHDADDEILPNFSTLARKWAKDGRYDVVVFAYEERNNETGAHLGAVTFDGDALRRDAKAYTIRNQINPFCGLYRRNAFLKAGGYDEDPLVLYNEDVALHIRLAFAKLSFAAESEISIVNHRRVNSMSSANRLKCAQAQYHVLRKTAAWEDAQPYASDIASRLWALTGVLTAELDWRIADEAAGLALKLAGLSGVPAAPVLRALCRISPGFALRVREGLIRTLKPRLRVGYPGWRTPIGLI